MYDVVIIGAGMAGVVSAQRYLDAHPLASLVILEKDTCVGGSFNRRRLYPGFHTQFTVGMSEWADKKMAIPPPEDCLGDCYKAKHFTEYLEEYVEEKVHDGKSLKDRIRFNMDVKNVYKKNGGWELVVKNQKNATEVISTDKLIIAAGEFNAPNMPAFKGLPSFSSPVIHSANFGQSNILSAPNVTDITVIGGGKSAVDLIYESIKTGKRVTWIIRASGGGPGVYVPIDLPMPYKNNIEAAQSRLMQILQPCVLHKENSWWVWLLHHTWFGMAFITWFFGMLDKAAKQRANYHGRPEAKGFANLEYDTSFFWQNNTAGALHHSDFWDVVAKHVTVHRADITHLSHKTINLSDGSKVPCDALLLCTGWSSSLDFFSEDLKVELGLPHSKDFAHEKEDQKWRALDTEAEKKVLKRFPMLTSPPPHYQKTSSITPYRLYNGMIPVKDSKIVFLNHLITGNMAFNAEVQSMWAVAYLDGNLPLPSTEEREKDVATWVMYCKRRYLSKGQLGNWAVFDIIAYADKLMTEMGTKTWWKGWKKDSWEVNGPADLGRAWNEYLGR